MPDLVSVIIPTFNRPHLLVPAVESVLAQTHRELEVLVVDDGSSAPNEEALASFDSRVRYFRQNHGGLNKARNRGLQEARGEFIALLDDDDQWMPYKTELQVAVLKRFPKLAYVFSEFQIFNAVGIVIRQGLASWQRVPRTWESLFTTACSATSSGLPLPAGVEDFIFYQGPLYRELLHAPYVLPSTAMVRRSAIGNLAFLEDNHHCGDWFFFAKLGRCCDAGFLGVATTLNRSHDDAVRLTRKSPRLKILNRLAMTDALWKADADFMASHSGEVNRVESSILLQLAQASLLDGLPSEARQALRRWRSCAGTRWDPRALILHLSAHMPFGTLLLRCAVTARQRLAS